MIDFNTTEEEANLITEMAMRAADRFGADVLSTEMDIAATHLNGNPLKLDDLLAADDFNFAHDINGIARHLDRDTGKLMHCFLPRFSA